MTNSSLDLIQLPDKVVHLWHIHLPPFISIDPDKAWLTEDEKLRANRYMFEKHQVNFATCRKLLKKILASYLQCSPIEVTLITDQYGKPYLDGKLKFNLSHSGDYFFLGICINDEIGVDIEQVKARDFLGLAKHSFSETEEKAVFLAKESHRAEVFYKIWCQKEAFIKFEGSGLRYPLKEFSVSSDQQGGLIHCKAQQFKDIFLFCYQSAPGLFAGVCIASHQTKIAHFSNVDLNLLFL